VARFKAKTHCPHCDTELVRCYEDEQPQPIPWTCPTPRCAAFNDPTSGPDTKDPDAWERPPAWLAVLIIMSWLLIGLTAWRFLG
jgi:hypothetical protein